ncbi:GyrI-like domain-containing protein [Paenibacillus macerans]|uniref:GyrI-like domain-containing protein n=1 Tax=Paenibacillus macerans TaxID=44252 RepID=UPI003D31625F
MDESICDGELSGGKYAVCKVKHTSEDLQQAWAEIFQVIQSSGYQMAHAPVLERYTGDMLNRGYCEICIPVIPL